MSRTGKKLNIENCMDDLERRIDPGVEDGLFNDWKDFSLGKFKGDIFAPVRKKKIPPATAWPQLTINAAQEDFDAMLIHQLRDCSKCLEDGNGALMNARSNYGTGIMSSLFGAEMFFMDEALNTLPTTRPLKGVDAICAALDAGVPDMRAGLGGKVLDMGRRFAEAGKRYPKIGRYVHVYHPDLQGPMDVCELLWGSGIFLDLFDHPNLVHSLLRLVVETYSQFMREWEKIVPRRSDGLAVHWGMLHRGTIMLRDDSAMNLSPEMYDEFIKPYDQQLLDAFGGGAVHSCGRGDHYVESASSVKGLYAVNLSQPHLNNMETVFSNTVDKGIVLLGLDRKAAESAVKSGRNLHGRVHSPSP